MNYLTFVDREKSYAGKSVNPILECTTVWGTKREGGERAVDIIPPSNRFVVTTQTGVDIGWIQSGLRDELVIDFLVVSRHVSLKALDLWPDSDV